MGFRDVFEELFDASGEPTAGDSDGEEGPRTVIYECRHCGTSVTARATTCPTCGADEIAEYAIR